MIEQHLNNNTKIDINKTTISLKQNKSVSITSTRNQIIANSIHSGGTIKIVAYDEVLVTIRSKHSKHNAKAKIVSVNKVIYTIFSTILSANFYYILSGLRVRTLITLQPYITIAIQL